MTIVPLNWFKSFEVNTNFHFWGHLVTFEASDRLATLNFVNGLESEYNSSSFISKTTIWGQDNDFMKLFSNVVLKIDLENSAKHEPDRQN